MDTGERNGGAPIALAGETVVAERDGSLWWPRARALAFADLHFEKGSAYAGRGSLLPPYDTAATLAAMAAAIARRAPSVVVCLGDSFHDAGAPGRLDAGDAGRLRALMADRRWLWIAGNHDPAPPAGLGGETTAEWRQAGLTFRHQAAPGSAAGEVSGHFHPKAHVRAKGRLLARRCFLEDGRRIVLPAYGAYAGGLDCADPAFGPLFPEGFRAHVLGRDAVHSLAGIGAGAAASSWK
jgi:uncharacterized protein